MSYNVYTINKQTFPVYRIDLVNANLLEVVAGTTGQKGGDSGHGCRTFIRIKNHGGTDIRVNRLGNEYYDDGVELILGGDTELETIIDACEFIAKVLKNQK